MSLTLWYGLLVRMPNGPTSYADIPVLFRINAKRLLTSRMSYLLADIASGSELIKHQAGRRGRVHAVDETAFAVNSVYVPETAFQLSYAECTVAVAIQRLHGDANRHREHISLDTPRESGPLLFRALGSTGPVRTCSPPSRRLGFPYHPAVAPHA